MGQHWGLPRPTSLEIAIDAEHVAVLESAIAQLAARHCGADSNEADRLAWEQALDLARARERDRLTLRQRRTG